MGRLKKDPIENLKAQIESGKFDKLLKPTTSQDNQERRKTWRKTFNSFMWQCVNLTGNLHRKQTREAFRKVFDDNIAAGLLRVVEKWQEAAAIGRDLTANENSV